MLIQFNIVLKKHQIMDRILDPELILSAITNKIFRPSFWCHIRASSGFMKYIKLKPKYRCDQYWAVCHGKNPKLA